MRVKLIYLKINNSYHSSLSLINSQTSILNVAFEKEHFNEASHSVQKEHLELQDEL